jgi:glucokinase
MVRRFVYRTPDAKHSIIINLLHQEKVLAEPASESEFALAVDIGGTKMEVAFIDRQGNLLIPIQKHYVPFDANRFADPDGLIDLLRPYVVQAQHRSGIIIGIGLSVCGNIDRHSGDAILCANLGWRYVPFGRMVKEAFELPVYAATDVRMAALAEAVWGKAQNVLNFAWATIGTGFGGYLFLNGELYEGSHGFAGNFGHNTYDEIQGRLCGCGLKGCFESYASGPAIARAGQAAADAGKSPLLAELAKIDKVTTPMVFKAEAAGDPAAVQIIEDMIRFYAISFSGLVNILDLEMIVVGGGVTRGNTDLVDRISVRARDYLMTVEARRDLQIVHESFANSALFGAAATVFLENGLIKINPGNNRGSP